MATMATSQRCTPCGNQAFSKILITPLLFLASFAMVSRVNAGDIPRAIANFSSATAEGYRRTFLSIGMSGVTSDLNQTGSLTPVFIRADTSEYYFRRSIDGHLLLFPVEFVKEN